MQGVTTIAVNLATDSMQVEFDPSKVNVAGIVQKVTDIGYEAVAPAVSSDNGETLRFSISGMHCAACSARIEKVTAQMPEFATVEVNLATESARVTPCS